MNERATLIGKLCGYSRPANRHLLQHLRVVFATFAALCATSLHAAPGDLDSGGFASGAGFVLTDVIGANSAVSIARQTDGKIVIAGSCLGSAASDFCLVRYEASGTPDTSFDGDGFVSTDVSGSSDTASGIAIQADGKIVVGGYCNVNGNNDFCLARYLLDGSLDTTFGTTGKIVTGFSPDNKFAYDIAIQSDGKIILAGGCFSGADFGFCAARFLSSGALDTLNFGVGGVVMTQTAVGTNDYAIALTIQPDGKIVLAGNCPQPGIAQICMTRLLSTGALDPSFGSAGVVSTLVGSTIGSEIASIALQSDGKIVVGGVCRNPDYRLCVLRYQSSGVLDNTFGVAGVFMIESLASFVNIARAVLIQADGKIVAAGNCSGRTCAVRLTTDGRLDPTFDGDGIMTDRVPGVMLPGVLYSQTTDAHLQPDGKLLLAGTCTLTFSATDFCLARYRADGSLDTSLQASGKAISPIAPFSGNESLNATVVQPDGRIVSVGGCNLGGVSRFCVSRHLAHGALDESFLGSGVNQFSIGVSSSAAVATAAAVQPDGKIVVVGYCTPASSGEDFCVARLLPDGTLDSSFGASGKATFSFSSGSDRATALAIQPDGKILVVGTCPGMSLNGDFCKLRLNPNGKSLDISFGVDGLNTEAIGSGYDNPAAIALLPDGRFVVAGLCAVGADNQFCAARFNPDGSLDSSFDGDGRVLHPIAGTFDDGWALALQPDGKVVIAGGCFVSGLSKFCAMRLNVNGSLDTSFDGDGKVIVSFGTFSDSYARGVAIQPDGKIVLGGSCSGAGYDFCVARLNDDGSLDMAFSGDGLQVASIDPGTGNDNMTGIALQSDGKILLAGYCGSGTANDFCFARFQGDANGNRACSMDIDGDGVVLPTTDLLIATRVARGMIGSDVIRGVSFAVSATRTSWAEIRNFLVASCGMAVQP